MHAVCVIDYMMMYLQSLPSQQICLGLLVCFVSCLQDKVIPLTQLAAYSAVLTTYGTLASEVPAKDKLAVKVCSDTSQMVKQK